MPLSFAAQRGSHSCAWQVSSATLLAITPNVELGGHDAEVAILLDALGELSQQTAVEFDSLSASQTSHSNLVAHDQGRRRGSQGTRAGKAALAEDSLALQKGNGPVHGRPVDAGIQLLRSPVNHSNVAAVGSRFDDAQNRAALFRQTYSASQEHRFKRSRVRISHGEGFHAQLTCHLLFTFESL